MTELIRRAIDEGRLLGRDASPADVNDVAERLCACLPAALEKAGYKLEKMRS